uniref:Maturase K n=1 Tax=Sphaerochara prolifera TaxID=97468 RepID=Q7YKX6_9VIRI|nr:maturase K [Tolypella prolifera]
MSSILKNYEYKKGFYPLFFFEEFYIKVSVNTNYNIFKTDKRKEDKKKKSNLLKKNNSNNTFHFLLIKRLIRKIRQQSFKWSELSKLNDFPNKTGFNYQYQYNRIKLFYILIIENMLFLVLGMVWQQTEEKNIYPSFFIKKSVQFAFPFLEQKVSHSTAVIQGKVLFFYTTKKLNCLFFFLYQRIRDKVFISLLKKIFKFNRVFLDKEYYPEILYKIRLFTLLTNLYGDEFDSFVAFNILRAWNLGYLFCPHQSIEDSSFLQKINIIVNVQKDKINILSFSWLVLNFLYSTYGHIHYIRRGITFLITLKVGKDFSRFWKFNCVKFMQLNLKSNSTFNLTQSQFSSHQNSLFLGYRIVNSFWQKKLKIRGSSWSFFVFLKDRKISTEIPVHSLISNLTTIKLCNRKGYPIHKASWSTFSDKDIINIYHKFWNELSLYYCGSSNRFDLSQIQYIFEFSCIKTLAFKHKSNIRLTWEQYKEYVSFSNLVKSIEKYTKISFNSSVLFQKKNKFWLLEISKINILIASTIDS